MNPAKTGSIPSVKKAYKYTVQYLQNNPLIFLPFIIFAIFELIALIILYLSPRMPLRLLLGPPISTFWTERFLHYPANFLLLPKLASLSRMVLSIFLGSLLTGMAIFMIYDVYNKKHIKLKTSFRSALKKYLYLFTIVFILLFLFYILKKIITIGLAKYFIAGNQRLLFLKPKIWLGPIFLCLNFIFAIFIQSSFIYAIPILLIENDKLIKSIIKSFVLFKKFFIPTLILISLPMLIYIPIIVLEYKTAFLINKLFPEFILLVLFLGIIIASLIIDPLISISTTLFYLMHKDNQ